MANKMSKTIESGKKLRGEKENSLDVDKKLDLSAQF